MQLANVPRWSLHGEVMPGKLGLQPAAEGSFPLAGGEGVCPTEQCKQWGRGSWGTPLSALLLQGTVDRPGVLCVNVTQLPKVNTAKEQHLMEIKQNPKKPWVKSVSFYQHVRGAFYSYNLLNLHLDP